MHVIPSFSNDVRSSFPSCELHCLLGEDAVSFTVQPRTFRATPATERKKGKPLILTENKRKTLSFSPSAFVSSEAELKSTTRSLGNGVRSAVWETPTATSCVANWALVSARKRQSFPTGPVRSGIVWIDQVHSGRSRSTSAATPGTQQRDVRSLSRRRRQM